MGACGWVYAWLVAANCSCVGVFLAVGAPSARVAFFVVKECLVEGALLLEYPNLWPALDWVAPHICNSLQSTAAKPAVSLLGGVDVGATLAF